MQHWRKHGPRSTYLASTCSKTLDDGSVAKLCYIMPKYSLRLAVERPGDMSAAMALALATSPSQVEKACAHPSTHQYCIQRHTYLRQSFVSLYVCEGQKIVDTHRDYVVGGGFSEHSVFMSEVISANGYIKAIPQGPKSDVQKKKGRKKAKQSEKTKAMPAPPGLQASSKVKAEPPKDQPADRPAAWDVKAFLPGLAVDTAKLPILACVGADRDGDTCMAQTKAGTRCARKKVQVDGGTSNFCRQHYNEVAMIAPYSETF